MADREKEHGVVYTPETIVSLILDRCEFREDGATRRRLIDPSCGEGAFLIPAAKRIIEHSSGKGLAPTEIRRLLEANLAGAELDPLSIKTCREKLDALAQSAGVTNVEWDLRQGDSLDRASGWFREVEAQFDVVVGNPPYVRIQHLGAERRERIRSQWRTCGKGSTDLFIAFFELGFYLMKDEATLGFITPRSYFNSDAGRDLRDLMIDTGAVRELIDFGATQIFEDVTTYTAITICKKPGVTRTTDETKVSIEHRSAPDRVEEVEESPLQDLRASRGRWVVARPSERQFVQECENRGPSLGEVTAIRVGLATLADRIYVLRIAEDQHQPSDEQLSALYDLNGKIQLIERDLLKPITKVSRLKGSDTDQGLRIVFPYAGPEPARLTALEESSFKEQYPHGYAYLEKHRSILDTRGHETKQWFEYGSSQGIRTCFGSKLLVPPMTLDGRLVLWTEPSFTFFSGYGIYFDGNLEALLARLSEEDFRRYIRLLGRSYRGGYFSITKRVMEKFSLTVGEWKELGIESLEADQLSLDLEGQAA